MTDGIKVIKGALDTDLHQEVKEQIDIMRATKRIVDEYEKGSGIAPDRQRPWIPQNIAPEVKEGFEDLSDSGIASATRQARSPSRILGGVFDAKNNPVVDSSEALMAFTVNYNNGRAWAKDVLRGVEDSTKQVEETLQTLYDEVKPLTDSRDKNLRHIHNLEERHRAAKGEGPRKRLWTQIQHAKKKLKRQSKKINEELTMRYDSEIFGLARDNADVRITLQIAEELPAGISLSEQEMEVANKIKDYFTESGAALKKVGIPIIEGRQYMHKILPDLIQDSNAQGFIQNSRADIPLLLKFRHQAEDSRIWFPSMHMILNSYVPLAERKIAYQPFLNRWAETVDQLPENLRKYMNQWIDANLFSVPLTRLDKFTNGLVTFEYLRLIGGSISVAFKHATKVADTLARFDTVTNAKALNATSKAVLQGVSKKLGYKGPTDEWDLMRAYVNQDALIKMMDETPMMTGASMGIKKLLGAPTLAVETFDNGVSIFATMVAAGRTDMSPADASRIIWETVLAANFRGRWDQPLLFKRPGVRLVAMFQMTPHKLFEYRAELLTKAVNGEKDAFGTPYGAILLRYIFLMGLAETVARLFGNTLIDQLTHTPYVSHWLSAENKKGFGGYRLHEPTAAPSPIFQWALQMGKNGILTGSLEHLDYFGQFTKTYQFFDGDYPRSYYRGPWTHQFGIKKVGAGHKKKQERR